MHINLQTLIHLPVYTQSGVHLGRVHDMQIDIESHAIKQYIVESGLIAKHHYLIGPAQVIAITAEKIVVDDAANTEVDVKEKPVTENPPQTALGGAVPITK